MSQRGVLILAAVMTAFCLVVFGAALGGVFTAAQPGPVAAPAVEPAAASAASAPVAVAPEPIPQAAALVVAQACAPGAKLLSPPELVSFRGTSAWEVVLDSGNVYVDAASALVLHDGTHQSAPAPALRRDEGREHREHEGRQRYARRERHEDDDDEDEDD
jgi:hypothetical protein